MNMPKSTGTSSRNISDDLLSRFNAIVKSNLPFFNIFNEAVRFSSQPLVEGSYTGANYGAKTLIAAILDLNNYSELKLASFKFDEDCDLDEVEQHRTDQTLRLKSYMESYFQTLEVRAPVDLYERCWAFIELFQPTSRVQDEYPEIYLTICQKFPPENICTLIREVASNIENGMLEGQIPTHKVICQARAIISLASQNLIPREISESVGFQCFLQDVGIAAVQFANSGTHQRALRAAGVLMELGRSGHEYASIQAAQMFSVRLNTNRINLDLAESLIDNAERQLLESRFHISKELYNEYLMAKLTIKLMLIVSGLTSDRLIKITREVILTLMDGAVRRFEGFAASAVSFITPSFAQSHAISDNLMLLNARAIVDNDCSAAQLCLDEAKTLVFVEIQNRFEGDGK